jgi:predicted transcriptional regulator
MSTTSIRVEKITHDRLARLARAQGRSMTQIVGEAIAKYEEDLFWQKARDGYERMNADPEDRAAYDAGMALWDTALGVGLEDVPHDE